MDEALLSISPDGRGHFVSYILSFDNVIFLTYCPATGMQNGDDDRCLYHFLSLQGT